MSRRESGLAVILILGTVLMLGASPAAALCAFECTCSTSCNEVCEYGPEIPDCPECNETTCGEWGTCIDSEGCTPGGQCPALSCTSTINGSSGSDTLNGSSNHECIYGFGGVDLIYGNAGDDTVYAGAGLDTVSGGSGNDCLYGEDSDDSLTGNTGTDFADGGPGSDGCDAEFEVNCES